MPAKLPHGLLLAALLLGCAGVSGCAAHATRLQLASHAAHDLDCPRDNLRYRELDESSQWVAGCGKSATYRERCRHNERGKEECDWVQQTDEEKARE